MTTPNSTPTESTGPLWLAGIVLDCPRPRELAEFYAELLGWSIAEADSDDDWVVLADPRRGASLSFQRDPEYVPPTWPEGQPPQMVHLDIRVLELAGPHERALAAGATPLPQPPDRRDATFQVYADPAGHPFCLCR